MRPVTVFRNKVTIDELSSPFALMTWGAAQLGVAQGVLDAVADGLLPPEAVDELMLIAAVWVDPERERRDGRAPCEPRGDARARSPTPSPTRTPSRLARMQSRCARPRRNAFYAGD